MYNYGVRIDKDAGAVEWQGGSVKELRAMETYKKQKNRYQLRLFLLINNGNLKILPEIMENHSEFSGCVNNCNKLVSSRP